MMKNFLIGILLLGSNYVFCQQTIIVSPENPDKNLSTHTLTAPDIASALRMAAQSPAAEVNIYLREGTYRLNAPLEITSGEFKNKTHIHCSLQTGKSNNMRRSCPANTMGKTQKRHLENQNGYKRFRSIIYKW